MAPPDDGARSALPLWERRRNRQTRPTPTRRPSPPARPAWSPSRTWIAAVVSPSQAHSPFAEALVGRGFQRVPGHEEVLLRAARDPVSSTGAELEDLLDDFDAEVRLAVLHSDVEPPVADVLAELEPAERALSRIRSQWLVPMLAQRRLVTYLQPVFDRAGEPYGEEALVRGLDPAGELVDGRTVMLAARDLELEGPVDRVLCEQSVECSRQLFTAPTRLFVNLSRAGVERADATIASATRGLRAAGLEASHVYLEISDAESLPLADVAAAAAAFRAAGFRVSLDDLAHPTEARALVDAARPDVVKLAPWVLARAVAERWSGLLGLLVDAARAHGALVGAKGIETSEDLAVAQRAGLDLFQGHLLARPRPAAI